MTKLTKALQKLHTPSKTITRGYLSHSCGWIGAACFMKSFSCPSRSVIGVPVCLNGIVDARVMSHPMVPQFQHGFHGKGSLIGKGRTTSDQLRETCFEPLMNRNKVKENKVHKWDQQKIHVK